MAIDETTEHLPMTQEERDAVYRDVMGRLDRIGGPDRSAATAEKDVRRSGNISVQSIAVLIAALVVSTFDPSVAGILAVSALAVELLSRVRIDHAA